MTKTLNKLLACLLAMLLFASTCSIPAFATGGDYQEYELPPNPNPDVLYPEGNMTIVSDVAGEAANEKEFLIVTTKNGNYFYIIIDRSADGENTVHFLNKVDESDLLALMSDKEVQAYQQSQQPVVTPPPVPTPTPTPPVSPEPTQDDSDLTMRAMLLLVLLAILVVLITVYIVHSSIRRKEQSGGVNLDDYEFDDPDEEEYFDAEKYNPEEDK